MQRNTLLGLTAALLSSGLSFVSLPTTANAGQGPAAGRPMQCVNLPTKLLGGNIKYANAQIVPANTAPGPQFSNFTGTPPSTVTVPVAYCLVVLSYSSTPKNDPTPQNITIYVGLPLNSMDGGITGSTVNPPNNFTTVEGNWNGRTEGQGGGGCTGNNNVNSQGAVANGFVGSGTDGGHGNPTNDPGNTCQQGVLKLGQLNYQYIQDWVYNGPQQEILWSKKVANLYYGKTPKYNYWNGCSTGGHQGYALAQTLGGELDGILANAPAMYWTRFQTAQMWGQIAMKDLAGQAIDAAKLAQATASAVAACDAADGVVDGVIDEPRACTFSAKANLCGAPTAPTLNCLNAAEAEAIDRIWDGPRNRDGKRVWFGLDRGTNLAGLNGAAPFFLGVTQFHWDTHNRAFDWTTVTMNTYADVAQQGSRNIADVTDTFDDLDVFRASGGKLLTMVGANDQLIMPQGVLHYYRQMARRYGGPHDDDFSGVQKFYRLFRAPGVAHCAGGAGPQPQGLFDALVNWVENKVPPKTINATVTANGVVTRSRPLCPYPQTAIYNGSGSTDDAASFHCGGNLETREEVCDGVLVKYKHEVDGRLDYREGGTSRGECRGHGHHRDHDD